MDINFATEDLATACGSARACSRRWGDQHAKVIMRRLAQLRAAGSLYEMSKVGAAHLHELAGDHEGQLAVNAKDGKRIVFEPDHEPRPVKTDGGLDWHRVTAIRIHSIENYHRG